MRKIHIVLLFISVIGFISCGNDWLDLEPTNETLAGRSLSLREAEASANGLYGIARDYNYYGARMVYFGDVRGDDFMANGGTKRAAQAYTYGWSHEDAPSSLWLYPYKVIRNANNILRAIDDIETTSAADETTRKDVKGQALTMRALAYFDICRVYGYPYLKNNGASLGASIVLEDELDPDKNLPRRNTVKETYEKVIIPDLLEAIPLLLSSKSSTQGRVGKMTAMTLLSRVYLYCGNWGEAFKYAKMVIDEHPAAGFKLYKDEIKSRDIWSSNSPSEAIFELMFSATDAQDNEMLGYLNYESGYDDIVTTVSFMQAWDPKDTRKTNGLLAGTKSANKSPYQRYFINKFIGPSATKPKEGTLKLMRISEAYLNAAEASVFLADAESKQLGLEYYNTIHERAGLDPKASITLEDVLEERRFEFFGEGHRYFDLLRHGKTIHRSGAGHLESINPLNNNVDIDWNNYMIALPIPRGEINANPNIRPDQNPGWGGANS